VRFAARIRLSPPRQQPAGSSGSGSQRSHSHRAAQHPAPPWPLSWARAAVRVLGRSMVLLAGLLTATVALAAVPTTGSVSSSSVPPAVGAIGNGTCGPTKVGPDCNVAPKGSFPGYKTLESCVAKLKTCKMATYASWSLGWNDCSWYTTCDWDHLCADCTKPGPSCPNPATGGCPVYHPFTSEVLRKPGPSPSPPPPPPPPGPKPPPVGTTGNGTCGATSFGGDCNVHPKGAWNAKKLGITTLAQCVAKAKPCKMADYVSFSNVPGNSDCSWYSECDMSKLCADCHACGIGCPKYYVSHACIQRFGVLGARPSTPCLR
jgi:hypothetical protein